jgi:hypothetical protein
MHAANVVVRLIENSSAGHAPKVFHGQTVDIFRRADIIQRSTDGFSSPGAQPTRIVWKEGTADDFKGITDVEIVRADGSVLIDEALNPHNIVPRDVARGVEFAVLRRDA